MILLGFGSRTSKVSTSPGLRRVTRHPMSEIEAGNVYIDIRTVDNPSGELRGQL